MRNKIAKTVSGIAVQDSWKPLTERDPNSLTAQRERDAMLQALAAERIEWSAPASDRDMAQYRREIELARQARNRGARPAPLRAPGDAA